MKKETILLVVVTLVVGSLGGMIFSKTSKNSAPAKLTTTSAPVVDYQQKIKVLEEVIGKEPDNLASQVRQRDLVAFCIFKLEVGGKITNSDRIDPFAGWP